MVDENDAGVYPIKTTKQAFDDLVQGNAYVMNNSVAKNVDITDVTLGYYLGSETQPYTVPIYIFTGKNFIAYVQALASSALGQ